MKAARFIKLCLISLFITLMMMATTAAIAEIVSFSGTTPTEREDETALGLSEIKGFEIYCGATQGDYQSTVFLPGATLPDTTWDLDLNIGTHYCVISTVDIDDRKSLYSNEVTLIIEGKSRPNPPMIPAGTVITKTVTLP
jgi:hypothetical protein